MHTGVKSRPALARPPPYHKAPLTTGRSLPKMSLATLFANRRNANFSSRRRRIQRGRGPSDAAVESSTTSQQLGETIVDPKAATTKLSGLDRESHPTLCPFSAAIKSTIDDDAWSINHGINNSSNNNGKHRDDDGWTSSSGGFRFDFHLGSVTNSSNGTHNATHPGLCHEGYDDFAVEFDSSRDGADIRQESRGSDIQQESQGSDIQQESQGREVGTKSKNKKRRKKKGKQRASANSFDIINSENIGTMLPSREDQYRPTKSDRSPTRKCVNNDSNYDARSTKKSTKNESGTILGQSKSITERLVQKNDSTKTPLKSRIKPPPGFQFDPVVQRKGALVNRQSMGLHRQNRSNLSQQHGGVNTKEENDNSQQDAPDSVTNPFTFGFNILGDGLLPPPGI